MGLKGVEESRVDVIDIGFNHAGMDLLSFL